MTIVPLYQNPDKGGGVLGWSNCFPTVTAMQIRFATGNTQRPLSADVRRRITNDDGSPDVTGGTRPSQNVEAARTFGVLLDYRLVTFSEMHALLADPNVFLSICISYSAVAPTQFDASPGFYGNHQIGDNLGNVYDPLADARRPGIPQAPDRWPMSLIEHAAELYSRRPGFACVLVARAPKTSPRKFAVQFEPGAFFIYLPTGTRRTDAGFSKKTSASCSAPYTIPWGGGRKRVVTMLSGRLKGLAVEPTATHLKLLEL